MGKKVIFIDCFLLFLSFVGIIILSSYLAISATKTIPAVYWSTSKDECVKVYDGYQIIECSEFDFYDTRYERIWVK